MARSSGNGIAVDLLELDSAIVCDVHKDAQPAMIDFGVI